MIVAPAIASLQFGHSVAAVDDKMKMTEAMDLMKLQFGHSVAAVDDSFRTGEGPRRLDGFNSATASPPWMTLYQDIATRGLSRSLQLGHSVAAVDNTRRGERREIHVGSFNSATASPPWMTRPNLPMPSSPSGASIRPQRRRRG